MKLDRYHRTVLDEQDVCYMLYDNPDMDLNSVSLADPSQHNDAVGINYSELSMIRTLESLTVDPAEWHRSNQQLWLMPAKYSDLDIASWVLEQCKTQDELQRCGAELLAYQAKDLLPMLRYLKYLVDVMRSEGLVWGVGRGSSVASFVLFKLGVHKIDSLYYDLDFEEFMR